MKNVRIRSYSGPHFPAFGLNAERYGVSLRIQSECRKMGTRITPNTDSFYAVIFTKKIIMDTNRKFIYFKELPSKEIPNRSITVILCENANIAESILKSLKIVKPSKMLLHIDVNDIDEEHPQYLAFNLTNLAEKFRRKFEC